MASDWSGAAYAFSTPPWAITANVANGAVATAGRGAAGEEKFGANHGAAHQDGHAGEGIAAIHTGGN